LDRRLGWVLDEVENPREKHIYIRPLSASIAKDETGSFGKN
jgi:hypothetical protein